MYGVDSNESAKEVLNPYLPGRSAAVAVLLVDVCFTHGAFHDCTRCFSHAFIAPHDPDIIFFSLQTLLHNGTRLASIHFLKPSGCAGAERWLHSLVGHNFFFIVHMT